MMNIEFMKDSAAIHLHSLFTTDSIHHYTFIEPAMKSIDFAL